MTSNVADDILFQEYSTIASCSVVTSPDSNIDTSNGNSFTNQSVAKQPSLFIKSEETPLF